MEHELNTDGEGGVESYALMDAYAEGWFMGATVTGQGWIRLAGGNGCPSP